MTPPIVHVQHEPVSGISNYVMKKPITQRQNCTSWKRGLIWIQNVKPIYPWFSDRVLHFGKLRLGNQ